jgi:hypothetical protein
MKAVIYTGPNVVEVVDKPVPQPEQGEVVVKVGRTRRQMRQRPRARVLQLTSDIF